MCACGARYYVHSDARRSSGDSYYCASKFKGGKGCGSKRLHRIAVDAAIEQVVSERLTDARFLADVFAQVPQPKAPDLYARDRELAKLAARRQKWIDEYDEDRITKPEFHQKMEAVEKATREVEARIPMIAPPALDLRAAVAGLSRWALYFPTITCFATKRKELKRVVRRIPVIDGHIPSLVVSGAYLGDPAHTKLTPSSSAW
jgi:hypothetical protein